MKLNKSSILLTILLTNCCKTCLVHQKKAETYPLSTRSGIPYVENQLNLSHFAWWKKLKDPTLNQLIVHALACNNQIKSAKQTIKQAQAQLKAAQYAWIPTLDATVDGFSGRTWNSHIKPEGPLAKNTLRSNNFNPRFQGYFTGFVPGYTVNILNNISTINASKASLAIQQAQKQATQLSIISQISGTYFMLLGQREQLVLHQLLSKDLRALRQLEQIRFKNGASDLETLMRIDQQIAQEEAQIPQIETVVAQSENTINLLLNKNPGPVSTHNNIMALQLNHLIPRAIPSYVLKNRPDIMIALNNLKLAYAELGIAYSAFFPTISLTGLLGKTSLDLTNLLNISTNIWIAQAAASTKVLNPSAYQNVKAAKAGFYAINYEYLHTLRSVFADVDNNLTQEQQNNKSYLHIQKGYLAAKKSYHIAAIQYKEGATDYRTVINAKINLDQTQLRLVQEKAQLLDSMVQLYNALGGGSDLEPRFTRIRQKPST